MKLAHALTAFSCVAAPAFAEQAGYLEITLDENHHGRPISGAIFYPAANGGTPATIGDHAVFHGVEVVTDAKVAEGQHPVIALSHGIGGNYRSLGWLASAMAERGAIVVTVNHPNSTWNDFDLKEGMKHWTRAQDLSLALDLIFDDPAFATHADGSRVMSAGFSFGGWTALSMGGAKGNHTGIIETCRDFGSQMTLCDAFLSDRVNLQEFNSDSWNADYRDARVSHVFALDPGFVWGLEEGDVEDMAQTVTMVRLGEGSDQLLATDFDKSGLADMLPNARAVQIAPAVHFTAMPLCKPEGPAILAAEKDDPVCTDPEGTVRADVHQQIIDMMSHDLGL